MRLLKQAPLFEGFHRQLGGAPNHPDSFQIGGVRKPGSKAALNCDVSPRAVGGGGRGESQGGEAPEEEDSGNQIPKLPWA